MSKLLEDPKVAALVEKEVAKAVKETTKANIGVVKDHIANTADIEDKAARKLVKEQLSSVLQAIKA